MIIQHRASSIRLFGQHEHGLVSGVMAHHWVKNGRLTPECIMAVALHDYAWVDEDACAQGSPDGTPRDFLTLPTADKVALYRTGIDALERIHPYSALMVSHHYSPFVVADEPTDFRGTERARRDRLGEALGVDPEGDAVRADLDLLRLLDRVFCALPTTSVTTPASARADMSITATNEDNRVYPACHGLRVVRTAAPQSDIARVLGNAFKPHAHEGNFSGQPVTSSSPRMVSAVRTRDRNRGSDYHELFPHSQHS